MTTETNDRIASWEERRKQFSGGSQANQSQEPQAQSNSWEEKRRQFLEANQQPQLSDAQMANLDIPTDEILAYHNAQKPQQQPEMGNPVVEAGKGLLLTGTKVANIVPEMADTFASFGSWAGQAFGGDGTYQPAPRLQLPDELQPQDPYAKLAAEIGPYLIPLLSQEKAALALAGTTSKLERAAVRGADMVAENTVGALAQNSDKDNASSLATDLGMGVAGSGIARAAAPLLKGAYNTVASKFGKEAQQAAQQTAQQADRVASGNSPVGVDNATIAAVNKQYDDVAGAFSHDKELTNAARTLGIEPEQMFDAYLTKNKAGQEFQTQMALVPDSEFSVIRRDSLTALNDSAENLLNNLGKRNLSDMDDALVGRYNSTIKGLKDQEKKLYKSVSRAVPSRTPVNADLTEIQLNKWADDRGGWEYLSPIEKEVFEAVAPLGGAKNSGGLTYDRLDYLRKRVGKEYDKASTVFGNENESRMKMLYASLSDDMHAIANKFDVGNEARLAKQIGAQRFKVQKAFENVAGKGLDKSITNQVTSAISNLAKGERAQFHKVMNAIPENQRQQVIATSLNDIFSKGTQKSSDNMFTGMVNTWAAMKDKGTEKTLYRYLSPEARKSLESMYLLSKNVKDANTYWKPTGVTARFTEKFNDNIGFSGRMNYIGELLSGERGGWIGKTLASLAAAKTGGGSFIASQALKQTSGNVKGRGYNAVTEMMTSPEWKRLVMSSRGSPQAQQATVKSVEENISKSRWWREIYNKLPADEKRNVARLGIIGWFSGEDEGL
ncbi:hypothetical protein RB151_032170 [Providencia rettgeri]|uniref:hypothetical protein n=1 Tax=Providencia rettgeri TaxID=587 RepID=UPI0008FB0563|nr:hypothetical protein [Providencia rettgeri]APC12875.1 hypothetical protein RB151_032170 [Providencia rettgeri]